jgi:Lrp/AsnC family transcriptional regulator, leucine-responsive regulatory protein
LPVQIITFELKEFNAVCFRFYVFCLPTISKIDMDKLSWTILSALQENARTSFADIGRKVGLSAPAVAERIQKLEEGNVIKGYHAALSYEGVGYSMTAIIAFSAHSGNTAPFIKYIEQVQEVLECHRVTGNYCLYMKVAFKSPKHLEELINKFNTFGETTTSVILSSPVEHRVIR